MEGHCSTGQNPQWAVEEEAPSTKFTSLSATAAVMMKGSFMQCDQLRRFYHNGEFSGIGSTAPPYH